MTTGSRPRRVVFVFVDGFGLGAADPEVNPVPAARLPRFSQLLGGHPPVADRAPLLAARASLVGLDATLGVPGLPQSGTGHVALLTGVNAARLFGRHFGPWPPTPLRPLLAQRSILARAREAGLRAAFANAYPEGVVEALRARFGSAAAATGEDTAGGDGVRSVSRRAGAAAGTGKSRRSRPPYPLPRAGPPLAALAAGLLVRHAAELASGDAVASEIVNDGWRERLGHRELPSISARQAGANLARIALDYDLTFFAHYSLDYIGHRGTHADAVAALERLDEFLGGLLDHVPGDTLVLVASDHGNIEDVRAGHTRNPAIAIAAGADADRLGARLRSLLDVTPALLHILGAPAAASESDLPDPEHRPRQD